jgi:hypothetical protein
MTLDDPNMDIHSRVNSAQFGDGVPDLAPHTRALCSVKTALAFGGGLVVLFSIFLYVFFLPAGIVMTILGFSMWVAAVAIKNGDQAPPAEATEPPAPVQQGKFLDDLRLAALRDALRNAKTGEDVRASIDESVSLNPEARWEVLSEAFLVVATDRALLIELVDIFLEMSPEECPWSDEIWFGILFSTVENSTYWWSDPKMPVKKDFTKVVCSLLLDRGILSRFSSEDEKLCTGIIKYVISAHTSNGLFPMIDAEIIKKLPEAVFRSKNETLQRLAIGGLLSNYNRNAQKDFFEMLTKEIPETNSKYVNVADLAYSESCCDRDWLCHIMGYCHDKDVADDTIRRLLFPSRVATTGRPWWLRIKPKDKNDTTISLIGGMLVGRKLLNEAIRKVKHGDGGILNYVRGNISSQIERGDISTFESLIEFACASEDYQLQEAAAKYFCSFAKMVYDKDQQCYVRLATLSLAGRPELNVAALIAEISDTATLSDIANLFEPMINLSSDEFMKIVCPNGNGVYEKFSTAFFISDFKLPAKVSEFPPEQRSKFLPIAKKACIDFAKLGRDERYPMERLHMGLSNILPFLTSFFDDAVLNDPNFNDSTNLCASFYGACFAISICPKKDKEDPIIDFLDSACSKEDEEDEEDKENKKDPIIDFLDRAGERFLNGLPPFDEVAQHDPRRLKLVEKAISRHL